MVQVAGWGTPWALLLGRGLLGAVGLPLSWGLNPASGVAAGTARIGTLAGVLQPPLQLRHAPSRELLDALALNMHHPALGCFQAEPATFSLGAVTSFCISHAKRRQNIITPALHHCERVLQTS